MNDLQTQLRSYYEDLNEHQLPVGFGELEHSTDTVSDRQRSISGMRSMVPAIALVASLIVVVGVLAPRLFLGSDEPVAPTTIPEVATTIAETETNEPSDDPDVNTASLLELQIEWTLMPSGSLPFAAAHHNGGIAFLDSTWVVPNASCSGGDCLWLVSQDGVQWQAHGVDITVPSGSEYWSWVDDGTVWWVEAIGAPNPDLSTLELRLTHYDDADREWLERRFSFPGGFVAPTSEGIGNVEWLALGTCNYNMAASGSVFDLYFIRNAVVGAGVDAGRVMVTDAGGDFAVLRTLDRTHACDAGVIDDVLYSIDAAGITRFVEGEWEMLGVPDGPGSIAAGTIQAGRAFLRTETGDTWTSTSLDDWQLTDLPASADLDHLTDTDFGWLATEFVSRDALHWERIDLPASQDGGPGYANGLFFIAQPDGSFWTGRVLPSEVSGQATSFGVPYSGGVEGDPVAIESFTTALSYTLATPPDLATCGRQSLYPFTNISLVLGEVCHVVYDRGVLEGVPGLSVFRSTGDDGWEVASLWELDPAAEFHSYDSVALIGDEIWILRGVPAGDRGRCRGLRPSTETILFARTTDGEQWTVDVLDPALPDGPEYVCTVVAVREIAEGPMGYAIVMSFDMMLAVEAIARAQLQDDTGLEVASWGYDGVVELSDGDGEAHVIDLVDLGWLPRGHPVMDYLYAPDLQLETTRTYAWFSLDGVQWSAGSGGPIGSMHVELVDARDDGFVFSSIDVGSDGEEIEIRWLTADGRTWTILSTRSVD